MASSLSTRRSMTAMIIIAVVLTLLLAILAGAYYLLTRPSQLNSSGASQNRSFLFAVYGFQGDLLRRPAGVGFDSTGNIYVADTAKQRIVAFDPSGAFITSFGEPGNGPLQLKSPIDVAVAPDGRVYVVDKDQGKLVIYDATHKATNVINFKEEPPLSVTVANNLLFVTTPSGIVIGDLNGKFTTGYVRKGREPGQFDHPGGVAVAPDGTLYVADSLNYRVQAISPQGKVLWTYGKPLPPAEAVNYNGPDRKFGLPSNIARDDNGYLYVVDGLSSDIVVLDKNGKFIETFGDQGHDNGTFYYPDGIDYHAGRLAIADKFNDRVEIFSAPYSPAVTDQLAAGAPYGLLLLLIPLLLIPILMRRQSDYVLAPSFASALATDEASGPEIIKALRRVNATAELATEHDEDLKGLGWNKRKYKDEDVSELMDRFGLDTTQAEALSIAVAMKGKGILLAEEPELQAAGEDLDVNVVTYSELVDAIAGGDADKPAAGQSAEGDAE